MPKPAIYVRVSTKAQDHRSQLADLERWAAGKDVLQFRDKFTGKADSRPGWDKLWAAVERGEISQIIVWRLDRLGRSTRGLSKLFHGLQERGIGLVSLKDSLDLGTASGRLMAHVLASVAEYETEVRSERQRAGIAAARQAGVTWGGREQGSENRSTAERRAAIVAMQRDGLSVAAIARSLGISRQAVYRYV